MDFWKNRWRLSGKTTFTTESGEELTSIFETIIPPTDGDRTDIITECGKYYFGKTKKEFMVRMSKEEYLDITIPMIYFDNDDERKMFKKIRAKALKEMSWTPYKTNEQIAIIIEIKKGIITLKGK